MTKLNTPQGKPVSGRPVPSPQLARVTTSLDAAQVHADLHALIVRPGNDAEIRESFRRCVVTYSQAVGVAHVVRDVDGLWDLKPTHVTGRVPRRDDFLKKYAANCESTVSRQTTQIESFLGLQAIFTPIEFAGSRPEVFLVLVEESKMANALFLMGIVKEYFEIWLKDSNSQENAWKLTSLAALIELVSAIEQNDTAREACETAANELVRHLCCEHAAVALIEKDKLRVHAVSGQVDAKSHSRRIQQNHTALNETVLREEQGIYPAIDEDNQHLLLGHKQLAKEYDFEAVISTPLYTTGDKLVGALLVAGKQNLIQSHRMPNFLRASAPRIASALEVVNRAEISRPRQMINGVKRQLKTVEGKVWWGVLAVTFCMMLVPMKYRVRCSCELEATNRRFAVAPFEGLVERGFVEPGDFVEAGQLLAQMDGQSIRFRMASVSAELSKANKEREIELNNRNVPESLVADYESKSLKAERDLLRFQESRIQVKSPIDGIVLSGSLENAEGASVPQGEVLFEVGPIDQLDVEIAIAAEEIAHVEVGQSARIWIDGFESQSFLGKIESVSPRSQLRDARNVFLAKIRVDNGNGRLRPGMKGSVRIDGKAHTLGWNLFHKPWNYFVSRLTWW